MRVGGMRHSVEIWKNERVKDSGFGGIVDNFTKVKTIKAQVRKSSGIKSQNNEKTIPDEKLIIEVWNHHNINESMRLKWRGRLYGIDFISPTYDDRTQVLNVSYLDD